MHPLIGIAAHLTALPDDPWAAGQMWAPGPPDAGKPPVTFPGQRLGIRVELMLGGVWVDVSVYVLYNFRVRVERGRRPNQRKATAATCRLTLKNPDKRFSPRYVAGPYAGMLRQNTPLRVFVNPGSGDALRFTGKVPSWEPVASGHPNDRRVSITAASDRGRLDRNSGPIASAQRRFFDARVDAGSLLLYRSLEDGDFPRWTDGPPGSGRLPDLSGGGVASDNIPSGWHSGGGTSWAVDVDARFPLGEAVGGSNAVALRWDTQETISGWRLLDDGTGVGLVYYTAADGAPHSLRTSTSAYDGEWHHYRITAAQNGTGVDVVLYMDGVSVLTSTIASSTLGRNFFTLVQDDNPSAGAERMPAVGHVAFYLLSPGANTLSYQAFTGWAGETPAERWVRLLQEEGLTGTVREGLVDDLTMGAQQQRTLPDLLIECEEAAEGLIDETLDGQLRLSTLRSRYNGAVALSLDYAAGDVLPPFAPADDNDSLINRWTLDRPNGGEAVFEKTSGPLNSSKPEDDPLGVGLEEDSDTINLSDDVSLYVAAGWRVHRDTVDEPRYPSVRVELAKSAALVPQWLACDLGSRVLLANGPDDVGPNDPDEVLEGYAEEFDQVSWDLELFLEPASVYRVGGLSNRTGYGVDAPRLDCGGSTLSGALDTSTTSVAVTITDNCIWTHAYGDYPITVGAEDMTVMAVSAAGGTYPAQTQTLTVTRGVNGVFLAHAAGDEVHVKYPIILAR